MRFPQRSSGPAGVGNTTQYVYDWQDRQIVAIDPQDSQGRVTYTLTQYDNEGNAVETQHYWYRAWPPTCRATSKPRKAENSPAREALHGGHAALQNATAYDSLGEPYQTTDYFVVNGTAGPASTAETSSAWYDADGNEVKAEDPLGNLSTYGDGDSDEQTSVTQPAAQAGRRSPSLRPFTTPTATSPPRSTRWAAYGHNLQRGRSGRRRLPRASDRAGGTGYSTVTADGITDDTWTFSSLSPSKVTAANASCYDIYVSAGTTAGPSINNATAVEPGDQSAPWLGSQWQFWGTVELLSSSTPFVSVTYASGGAPGRLPPAADLGHRLRRGGQRLQQDRRPGKLHDLCLRQPRPEDQDDDSPGNAPGSPADPDHLRRRWQRDRHGRPAGSGDGLDLRPVRQRDGHLPGPDRR